MAEAEVNIVIDGSIIINRHAYKQGDRITVENQDDGYYAERKRTFLASEGDIVYYLIPEIDSSPYGVKASKVSPYVEPFPFKVGDVLRHISAPDGTAYHVLRIRPNKVTVGWIPESRYHGDLAPTFMTLDRQAFLRKNDDGTPVYSKWPADKPIVV